jgi:hypothetical protein
MAFAWAPVDPFLIGLYVWKVTLHRVAAPAGVVVSMAAVAAKASPVTRDAALFRIFRMCGDTPPSETHQACWMLINPVGIHTLSNRDICHHGSGPKISQLVTLAGASRTRGVRSGR